MRQSIYSQKNNDFDSVKKMYYRFSYKWCYTRHERRIVMTNTVITTRLEELRKAMKAHGVEYYYITTGDYHCSEYVSDFFKSREYFCGFTGSNGDLLVSQDWAGLWTDGRYFVQAEKELEGTGVTLYRMAQENVPTLNEYLKDHIKAGETLAFDGMTVEAGKGLQMAKTVAKKDGKVQYDLDLSNEVWTDRPALPCNPVWLLKEENCGRTAEEKLALVRDKMKEADAAYLLLSKLDDLMWLLNIRGNDVECNPVAMSYGFITMDDVYLFIQEAEITAEAKAYFEKKNIQIRSYQDVTAFLKAYDFRGTVMLDEENISYGLYQLAKEKAQVVEKANPTEWYKAVKTPREMEQIRDIYLEDSAAVCKFIYWLKNHIGKEEITEYSAAMKMDSFREKIHDFVELSFPTISAYQENAAMMHYEATETDFKVLEPKGMLLVDSGGTYHRGTTDVTRTIVIGEISDTIKEHYSKTVAGMLQLADTTFLYGCGGINLDIMARQPLWDLGIDYKCGTGHGIGFVLNVHEGPQSIRPRLLSKKDTPLEEGMIVSDEPGVYIQGSHGIRIENILEVKKAMHNGDGQFMKFEHLTYAPIDLEAIDKKYLREEDVRRLNAYHADVYAKISPYLDEEERIWLKEATKAI